MNIINLKCKWMMVASKRLGNVGALLDLNAYSLLWGNLPPKKGNKENTRQPEILPHFWFHAHPIAKEARLGGTDVCAAWSKARSSCIQIPCRH